MFHRICQLTGKCEGIQTEETFKVEKVLIPDNLQSAALTFVAENVIYCGNNVAPHLLDRVQQTDVRFSDSTHLLFDSLSLLTTGNNCAGGRNLSEMKRYFPYCHVLVLLLLLPGRASTDRTQQELHYRFRAFTVAVSPVVLDAPLFHPVHVHSHRLCKPAFPVLGILPSATYGIINPAAGCIPSIVIPRSPDPIRFPWSSRGPPRS